MENNTNSLPPVDKRILSFISEHHVFTLATSTENRPYVCACFYHYVEEENCFIFTSDHTTQHAQEMNANNRVAANIIFETKMTDKIQGVQITGVAYPIHNDQLKKYKKLYIKAFPIARLTTLHLWRLDISFLKMTHNRLGFGKKLIWKTEKKVQ